MSFVNCIDIIRRYRDALPINLMHSRKSKQQIFADCIFEKLKEERKSLLHYYVYV